MTIKDFKVGQTAYVLGDRRSRQTNQIATAAEVIKVGRKYVTVAMDYRQEIRFFEPLNNAPYLVEDKDYGIQRLLFKTTEGVDEYNELNDLRNWLEDATNWMKVTRYSLAQLRAVKKILEEDDYGKET